MKIRFWSFVALLFCCVSSVFAQMQDPVHWKFDISPVQANGTVTVTLTANIDKPWHLYNIQEPENGPLPTTVKFSNLQNAEVSGGLVSKSKAIKKFEQAFGMELSFFENVAVFQQKLKVKDVSADVAAEGYVEYMCCDDQSCLPPTKAKFSLSAKGLEKSAVNPAVKEGTSDNEQTELKKKIDSNDVKELAASEPLKIKSDSAISAETASTTVPVVAEMSAYGDEDEGDTSLWTIFLSGLIGGFIAVVTPCVWPIIPMTVSFFLKRSSDKAKGRQQALLYGLSIIVIYVALGLLVTGLFSANTLNALSTNAAFNVFLFLLLVLFACSFFGGFEIMLPASWSTAIDAKAEKVSGIFGILLMASTLVIVSFSCTGPIIGTLLVSVADKGNILAPAVGMFGFALALAIPFSVFAFFPSIISSMPRSGNWLNMVKVLLGFFELAFSLKFLSVADQVSHWGLLSRPTFVALWIVIFAMAGAYLLGKIKLPHDTDMPCVSVPRLLLAMGCFSFAVYLAPGLFGRPLNVISAFAPPLKTVKVQYNDYDEALKVAAESGKPLLVDFTGHGCVNCRKMEAAVWSNPEVANLMNEEVVLVSLYCDDRTPLAEPIKVKGSNGEENELETVGEKWSYFQSSRFGTNALPYYVMVSPNEKVYNHFFKFTETASDFKNFILDGIKTLSNSEKK